MPRTFFWLGLLLSPEILLSLQNYIPAPEGSYWIPLPWIFPRIQQISFMDSSPEHTQSEQTHTFSVFLFSPIAVDSSLAQHSVNLFTMCQQLCTCHVSEEGTRSQSILRALSLLPLLLSCLISGLCKTLPPAPLQHTASLFTFQFLLILTFFLPLFLSFQAAVFLEFPWGKP